jgi:hypothetical protein
VSNPVGFYLDEGNMGFLPPQDVALAASSHPRVDCLKGALVYDNLNICINTFEYHG